MHTESDSAKPKTYPSTGIGIRKGIPEDADRIHELHLASVRTLCTTHYPSTIIDRWLERRQPSGYLDRIQLGAIFVAELKGRVVGFGDAVPGSIEAAFVDPEFARRGIGRVIVSYGVAQARHGHDGPVRLEATLNAREFYERCGFREIGRKTIVRNQTDIPVIVMTSSHVEPSSVSLRPLRETDLEQVCVWRNDPDVTRHLARLAMTREDVGAWFASLRADAGDRACAILVDDALVGYAMLNESDPTNKNCQAGLIIGDKNRWGQGIGSIVARRLVDIAFDEVGMHRILAVASVRNLSSIGCFRRSGFREEGRLRHASLRGNEYFDLVLLSILEHEWTRVNQQEQIPTMESQQTR